MSATLRAGTCGLIIAATTIGGAKESISIRVSPAFAFAPAELVISTTIAPDADNRAVEITVDSYQFYRSSQFQLDGTRASKTTTVQFHAVPPGNYDVTAAVIRADGRRGPLARAHVRVLGSE
jgi:hypothetical protein